MAAGFARELGDDRVEILSAGTQPADEINPAVIQAMAEVGIDLGQVIPRKLTPHDAESSDYVVTMGCGDSCPFFPGKTYLDWKLDDPAGKSLNEVRVIRDQIKDLVSKLIFEISSH